LPEIILEFTSLTRIISFDDPIKEYLLKNKKEGMKIINKPKKRTSDRALFPILKIYKKNGTAIKKEIIKLNIIFFLLAGH
jgi:hypothetical protein